MMMGWPSRIWVALVFASVGAPAAADGILDSYQAARQNDPSFRAARYELEAGRLALPIARAGLLPVVSASSARYKNKGDRSFTTGAIPNQPLDYRYEQDSLNLRQPLFNYEAWARYRLGETQVAYHEALFGQREADLATRVLGAYLNVLLAKDEVSLAEAAVKAFEEQLRSASRRLAGGEGTRTEQAEVEARLRIAEAALIETKDRLAVAVRLLEDITGKPGVNLRGLRADFVPFRLAPDNLDEWIAIGQDRSPEIRAQRFVLEAAGHEVDRNRAGHLPTLDLVASVSDGTNESVTSLNQTITTRSLGVQLSIPLYRGGQTSAATEQAVANRNKSQSELDATINKVSLEVRRQFLLAQSGFDKIDAYARSVRASEVALEGTKKGFQAGIRTNVDVLDAQRQLILTQRDLAQARYEFLLNSLKLRAVAGTLMEKDIVDLDGQLEPPG